MDNAASALSSLFSKVPAAGTRDGTTVADTSSGQKAAEGAGQAGEKLSEAASKAEQKVGQVANEAEKKLDSNMNSSSGSSASKSSQSTTVATASVDKVSETADKAADQTVAPAVEHDTIKRQHETRERDVVEKEIHKDHYHTTVQPLKDQEVQETKHDYEQAPVEYRSVDKDDGAAEAKVAEKLSGFQDTSEARPVKETHAQDETVEGTHVHHHHHEVVQPVIEKEIIQNSVTHKTNPIKETIHEKSEDHGVTKKAAMSVDDFKHRLDGENATTVKADKVLPEVHDSDAAKSTLKE